MAMTKPEFIAKLLDYFALNGIKQVPIMRASDGTPVPGYVQTTHLVYSNPRGRYEMGVDYLMAYPDSEGPQSEASFLFDFLGLGKTQATSWQAFLHPPAAPSTGTTPSLTQVGPRLEQSIVDNGKHYGLNTNAEYYRVMGAAPWAGQVINENGTLYMAVQVGMFTFWWMKL